MGTLFEMIQMIETSHTFPKASWASEATAVASQLEEPVPLQNRAKSIKQRGLSPNEANLSMSDITRRLYAYSLGSILAIRYLESGGLMLVIDSAETKTKILQH